MILRHDMEKVRVTLSLTRYHRDQLFRIAKRGASTASETVRFYIDNTPLDIMEHSLHRMTEFGALRTAEMLSAPHREAINDEQGRKVSKWFFKKKMYR